MKNNKISNFCNYGNLKVNSLKENIYHVCLWESYLSHLPLDSIARFAGKIPLSPNKPTRFNNENR